MSHYTALTFAPVQGFIERSRKLRDLYGASMILSYLSRRIADKARKTPNIKLVSPGLSATTKGMPNRLLLSGTFSRKDTEEALTEAWAELLKVCQVKLENWLDNTLSRETGFDWVKRVPDRDRPQTLIYPWEREWQKWRSHAWEVFVGYGDTPKDAQRDLETRKLSRDWTAINWIGESSSISGVDAIAYPRLEAADQNPNDTASLALELDRAKRFWEQLSEFYNQETGQTAEGETGKFISPNERLSIPELVKRLITSTKDPIIGNFVTKNGLENLESFSDMIRKTDDGSGHWTGWFMGDGDKFGDRLNELASDELENSIIEKNLDTFSSEVRIWSDGLKDELDDFGCEYYREVGRIIYSGGDDFLGAIYSDDPDSPIAPQIALKWLNLLGKSWKNSLQSSIESKLGNYLSSKITMSVGFVWVGHGVPQRDVLQHCREAEKKAKSADRDRVTIRVVFNSGQYVEWITPWEYLNFLDDYTDLDGKTGAEASWSHVYGDLIHLSSRYALGLGNSPTFQVKKSGSDSCVVAQGFCNFIKLYFPNWMTDNLLKSEETIDLKILDKLFPINSSDLENEQYIKLINWLKNAVTIGWYFLGNNQILANTNEE